MKILLKTLFLVFSFTVFIFPQFYAAEETSPYVVEFMRLAEETAKYFDKYEGLKTSFDKNEMERIVQIYYKSINEDPVGYNLYLNQNHQEWQDRIKNSNYTSEELKPAVKLRILKEEMSKTYGEKYIRLISIPVIARAKVISKNESTYVSFEGLKTRQTNIIVNIEDVLKGQSFINPGSDIVISYLNWWIEDVNKKFEIGKSYMILLRPWIGLKEYKGEITLHVLPDNNFGFYSIQNANVIGTDNYFETREIVSWKSFKEYFKNAYMKWEGEK